MKKKLYLYWLWMPIIHWILLTLAFQVLYIPLMEDFGYLPLALLFIFICAVVVSPVISILYCKRIRDMGWIKYICCTYNAVIIGTYGAIFFLTSKNDTVFESIIHSLSFFPCGSVSISSFICGLITLIIYDLKKRKTEDASLSQ